MEGRAGRDVLPLPQPAGPPGLALGCQLRSSFPPAGGADFPLDVGGAGGAPLCGPRAAGSAQDKGGLSPAQPSGQEFGAGLGWAGTQPGGEPENRVGGEATCVPPLLALPSMWH